jgi:hypothetical protein
MAGGAVAAMRNTPLTESGLFGPVQILQQH